VENLSEDPLGALVETMVADVLLNYQRFCSRKDYVAGTEMEYAFGSRCKQALDIRGILILDLDTFDVLELLKARLLEEFRMTWGVPDGSGSGMLEITARRDICLPSKMFNEASTQTVA